MLTRSGLFKECWPPLGGACSNRFERFTNSSLRLCRRFLTGFPSFSKTLAYSVQRQLNANWYKLSSCPAPREIQAQTCYFQKGNFAWTASDLRQFFSGRAVQSFDLPAQPLLEPVNDPLGFQLPLLWGLRKVAQRTLFFDSADIFHCLVCVGHQQPLKPAPVPLCAHQCGNCQQ